jgi:hypothetical protein
MQIRNDIPIPPRNAYSQFSAVALKMTVGDSVDVRKSQAVSMCQAIRRQGWQSTMRKVDDDTWRVWRTK